MCKCLYVDKALGKEKKDLTGSDGIFMYSVTINSYDGDRYMLILLTMLLCSGASGLHRSDSNRRYSNLEWTVHNVLRKNVNALEENGLSAMDKRRIVSWS